MTKTETTTKATASRPRVLRGVVVSDAMEKTVVVEVQRFVKHPKYKKYFKKSKRYQAHDENNQYQVGDKVAIKEVKPMSKNKTFSVVTEAAA